jgi:putative heme-binding domain-containing protein
MGALRPAAVVTALRDPHPGVLVQTLRLSEKFAAAGDAALLARVTAHAPHTDATVRQPVAYTLGEWRDPSAGEALAGLLLRDTDPFIRTAALSSALPHAATPLARLSGGADDDGALAKIATSTRQPTALVRLLATVWAARTPALPQIDASRRAALYHHANTQIASRLLHLFPFGSDATRQSVIDRALAAMRPLTRDVACGATVFASQCATCHCFVEIPGRPVGPDLGGVKDRIPEDLTTRILDPNRAIEDRYLLYTATTHGGRALSGLLVSESGGSVALLGLDGTEQNLLRGELATLASTGRLLMPEGLEAALDPQARADLIEFIARPPARR